MFYVTLHHQNPPSLSTMLKCAGRFILCPMTTKPFQKTYTKPCDLVTLLKSRGLLIADTHKAEHYISTIGYYRLSAYMHPFLAMPKSQHLYKPQSSFEKVMMLYRFDKKLRMFIFNEIEKIEVAIRSVIINVGSEMTSDPFWLTNPTNFKDSKKFAKTLTLIDTELKRSREDFITHFYKNYSNPYPPAWILAEVLPFGVITNIYDNIKNKRIQKRISQTFDLQIAPFQSWLTIVTLTRNSCCHHARVWNKQNTITPMTPTQLQNNWILLPTNKLRIYFDLCIIKYFIDIISPNNNMSEKLRQLLTDYPDIDTTAMGFPIGWESEPLWNTK